MLKKKKELMKQFNSNNKIEKWKRNKNNNLCFILKHRHWAFALDKK